MSVFRGIFLGRRGGGAPGPVLPMLTVSVTGSLAEGGTMTVTLTASATSTDPMGGDIVISGGGGNPLDAADFGGAFPSWAAVTIAPGGLSATRTFEASNDSIVEPDETGIVSIVNAFGALIGAGEAIFTVLNNDVVAPEPGVGPVNLSPPVITGDLVASGFWILDVGLWDTAVSFEVSVTESNGLGSNTLLPRQDIDGAGSGSIHPTVGYSMTLNVWASDAAGVESFAASALFGPIADGDELVGGFVFNPSAVSLPAGFHALGPNQNSVLYSAAAGYGMGGGNLSATGWNSAGSKSSPLLQGRNGINLSMGQGHLRVDLPDGPGAYEIYAGFTAASSIIPRLGIRDGATGGPLLLDFNSTGAINTGSSSGVADIAGNVTNEAGWLAASSYGGVPVLIHPTTSTLFIGAGSVAGSPQLSCITIVRKAI